jgi:AAA domain
MKNATAATENLRVTEKTVEPGAHKPKRANGKAADATLAPHIPRDLTLTIDQWLARDLPPPDFLLGDLLSTTTRALFVAPTGTGKTMMMMGLGFGIAAGNGFLHWRGVRPARVLMIDGEMSRRLLKRRIADEAQRCGEHPAGFHALSHEDIENFAPLNTPEGQKAIDRVIVENMAGAVDSSVAQIEKAYSAYISHHGDAMLRAGMLDLSEPADNAGNVVPLSPRRP